MKRLACRCGQAVYFANQTCTRCGRALAFDPQSLTMDSEPEPGAGLPGCSNRIGEIACNWLSPDGGPCLSCRTTRIIPDQSKMANGPRWRKLESAKRRLLYDLLGLGLSIDPQRLGFVFKEDQRTNPNVIEEHVSTGHRDGVITINAAEADEVYREQMRKRMNEPWRTLLGHFRHESGHRYFDRVVDDAIRDEARSLFGDEREDYAAAVQRHYETGPPENWPERFISAYATSHPMEDWAETWAHFLHIRAALEAAESQGLLSPGEPGAWRERFIELALGLNEVMRSLGLPDAYPFVITQTVAAKLDFIHTAIGRFTARRREP